MAITTKLINLYFTPRRAQIENFMKNPFEVQQRQLEYLTGMAARTAYCRERGIVAGGSYDSFVTKLPIVEYEKLAGLIDRQKRGEDSVLWPTPVKWYAKSSGTTGSKSKYIPVSDEGLRQSHLQGPRDVIALFTAAYPETKVFSGKTLTLGGSKRIEREGDVAFSGDLSAILLENTPVWANMRRVPSVETALIPDFEQKVERICREAVSENVSSFAGVPSWNLVMLNKVLEHTGKSNLLEIWPGMELFIYGGMNFRPYREQYRRLIPSDDMKYLETYNASEGFFSIADDPARDDMLLMLDYRVFYEFIPTVSLHDPSTAVPLEGVRAGQNYAMVITSSNGLWRYMIGDTVEFTSLNPHRIRITGRTKHYINAFGEELIIENAEAALRAACDSTGAEIAEYTAAPVYMEAHGKGRHEWIIEFAVGPSDMSMFSSELDRALMAVNSDYEAKRFKNTTLEGPLVTDVPPGTFIRWMEDSGKLGGQNKVPRLFNDRTYADKLIQTVKEFQPLAEMV